MKRILPLIFASISVTALATPIAYEGFDYALTPTNLVGHATAGFTWDQAGPTTGGTNVPAIYPGSLSYPGLAPASGNSVKFGGIDSGGMAARFSLVSSVTTGTLYYSFLLKVTDITALTTSGVFFAGFNNSAGAQTSVPSIVATRLVVKTNASGGGFLLGLDKSSGSTGLFQYDPTVHNVGDTVFVVGSYTFNGASTTDDVSQMWINPDSSTFGAASPPAPLLTSTSGNDLNGNVINSFCLFNRNANEPKSAIFDELTIGTTWSNVTPTAASMAIVTQPLDQRVAVGGKATFSVTTYRALTNQWQHDGADIPGATNTSLTISNAQLSDAGAYHVIVGNGVATPLTSNDATLTVKPDTFPRLSPLWSIAPFSRPYVTTDSSQLPMQRYFAYNALSNQVLIVSRTNTMTGLTNPAIYVLNGDTGADLYQMDTSSSDISGGLNGISLSCIDVADDGAVYGCDISDANSSVTFKLYRWDDSGTNNSGAHKVYEGDPYGLGIERYGDSLAVRGTNVNTDVLLDDSKGLYGVIMNPTDSSMTAFLTHDFTNFIGGLTGGRTVLFGDTNSFWEHHRGGALNYANYDITAVGSSLITNYNNFPSTMGVCGFNFSLNLLCGINSLDNTNAPDTLDLYDISDPSLPVYLASYNFPVNFQANANRCGRVIFAGDKVFALDSNNGFLAFVVVPRLSITPSGSNELLSWPTNFTGYTLTASPSLTPPTTWTNVGPGTIVGAQYVVTNTPSASSLFYRLKK